MHDTHGRAEENCGVGVQLGLGHFDAAIGGCGGCPFAPGAAGNVGTAELLSLLDRSDVAHGLDAEVVEEARQMLETLLCRPLR